MLKTLFTSESFHSCFRSFFVLLGIALSWIRKMLSSVTSAKREGERDSEPIRLLEIPTSPSLYMLINLIH